jgi:molecular chaperone DnaK (HSP70)
VIDWIAEEFRKEHYQPAFITADQSGPKHLVMTLARAKLKALVAALVERTVEPGRQVMKDAGVSATDVDEVVLVGGQTRMPKVQELVKPSRFRSALARLFIPESAKISRLLRDFQAL